MEQEKILRINYLAAKKKNEGLTESEAGEQKELYREYLAAVRRNFKATLDSIEIIDERS
ncbi:MAG: DUF896 domain-containing protein [Clostridia bacterium]|nr:DUF896 domain-containing protein [Clostridia bacterium]